MRDAADLHDHLAAAAAAAAAANKAGRASSAAGSGWVSDGLASYNASAVPRGKDLWRRSRMAAGNFAPKGGADAISPATLLDMLRGKR